MFATVEAVREYQTSPGQTSSGLFAFASHWLAKMNVKRSLSRRSL